MAKYTTVPTNFTSALVADLTATGGTAQPTTVGGVQVAAAFEVQSTTGGLLIPRMTTAQQTALTAGGGVVVDGLLVYVTDGTPGLYLRAGAAWDLIGSAGGGSVIGPVASTVNAIATWGNTGGTALLNSAIGVTPGGDFTTTDNNINFRLVDGSVALAVSGMAADANYLQFHSATAGFSPGINIVGADVNAGMVLNTKGTGEYIFNGDAVSHGAILALRSNNASFFYVNLAAPILASSFSLTLPTALPSTNGAALVSDTSGHLTFNNLAVITTIVAVSTLSILQMENGAAVPLLPAPGAGKMYVILAASIEYLFGITAFTGGGNIVIQYGSGLASSADACVNVVPASLFLAAFNNTTTTPTGSLLAASLTVNQPITMTNLTAPFGAGSGSTANVTLIYSIVPAV